MEKEEIIKQMRNKMAKRKTVDAKILAKISEPERSKFKQRMDSLDNMLEKLLNELEGR